MIPPRQQSQERRTGPRRAAEHASPLHTTIRAAAQLSDLYWSVWRRGGRSREQFAALADADWREALDAVCGYVFERAGPADFYREKARAAIRVTTAGSSEPDQEMPDRVWSEYLRMLDGRRPNERLNPLNPTTPAGTAITQFVVVEAASSHHNLIAWFSHLLQTARVAEASAALHRVPGVSSKIASFLLRDVTRAFSLDERALDAARYLQPIDVWTRRAAAVLAKRGGMTVPPSDRAAAELLCELAWAAEARPSDLNAGLWLLGAQLLEGDVTRYEEALQSSGALEGELETLHRRSTLLEAVLLDARAAVNGTQAGS